MRLIDHELFEGCADRIEDWCTERFVAATRNMDDGLREKAYERFFHEIEVIRRDGFAYEFEMMRLVMKTAAAKNRFVVARGSAVCSYVAYLLNITDVDPVSRRYEPELAYGFYLDRTPVVMFSAPVGFRKELENALVPSFGRGLITVSDENTIVIGVGSGADREDMFYNIVLCVHECDLVDRADRILRKTLSEYPGDSFATAREQVMRGPYPTGRIRDKKLAARIRNILIGLMKSEKGYEPELALNAEECIDAFFDGTYEGIVRASAVLNGAGLWQKGDKLTPKTAFYTREDVYRFGMKLLGKDKKLAFKLTEMVRKGYRQNERLQQMLNEYDVDKNIIERISRIKYMVNEGSCVTDARLILFVAENEDLM